MCLLGAYTSPQNLNPKGILQDLSDHIKTLGHSRHIFLTPNNGLIKMYISWGAGNISHIYNTRSPEMYILAHPESEVENICREWPKVFIWFQRYDNILFGARFWGVVYALKKHICEFSVLCLKWSFSVILAEISACVLWVRPPQKFSARRK